MQMLLGGPSARLTLAAIAWVVIAPCAAAEPPPQESPTPPAAPSWMQGLPELHQAGAPSRRSPVAAVALIAASSIDLALWTEASTYKAGDLLEVAISASIACHLTLIDVDRDGRAVVLLPNDAETDNLIAPGVAVRVPGPAAPYQLRLDRTGPETLIAICQRRARQPVGISFDYERQRFAVLGDWQAFLRKAAEKENDPKRSNEGRSRRKGKSELPPIDPDGPAIEGRAAITILVEEAAKP